VYYKYSKLLYHCQSNHVYGSSDFELHLQLDAAVLTAGPVPLCSRKLGIKGLSNEDVCSELQLRCLQAPTLSFTVKQH